ncbi:hypothetical protein NADFUDRAFT_45457 [Nadsonia fulvescens var. elongata DSM 6958]|uniref:Uncharacterized protein n=1 Tax=Nadsonia fulvescens var. elongata DSM 6958 TaxID=857566 RepID=A0A1E3PQX6_9ASCO|nr:hypothetical protein NADFUDRAFT_45457 [Nadsonia fulvescens var. elongata DSM 6958]
MAVRILPTVVALKSGRLWLIFYSVLLLPLGYFCTSAPRFFSQTRLFPNSVPHRTGH